jgi:hypothetical protein
MKITYNVTGISALGVAAIVVAIVVSTVAACSDDSRLAPSPEHATAHNNVLPGTSADGTAGPSVPSASEVFASEALAAALKPSELSKGGTEDMKKSLSKASEETRMPLVGHGNNHSAPDSAPRAASTREVIDTPEKTPHVATPIKS